MKITYRFFIQKFRNFGMKYFPDYLKPLQQSLARSHMNIVYDLYIGKMFFYSFLSFIIILAYTVTMFSMIGGQSLLYSIASGLIMGFIGFFSCLVIFHTYPFQVSVNKKNSIEANMPFALNHMAAIAASGVPPHVMFKLISHVPEYGEIKNVSEKIIRNINAFGMDTTAAVKDAAERVSSENFRQFLYGIISTIETGGDLKKYLEASAKDALFEYELKRERYLTALSTYADFYTAVLIAAPLFFVSILSIMSLIGGRIMDMDITTVMNLGIYVIIPMVNVFFLAFVHYSQPTV
ncbi:MAG: type II secretion system F family protein [Candidatus Aenigmarchaeota archaeon]|nr:type II secretion system F family protein [Candidatus Aenigmarchaeota archaeon]